MRRLLFWTAVLVPITALLGGAAYAYFGYRATAGPDGTVRGYFAALARSDAPTALAFGDVPTGPHDLLTSAVLAQQQKIAPLHELRITSVDQAGDEATVGYTYQLRFARGNQEVRGELTVRHRPAGWRLAQAAVPVTVDLQQASDRLTFAGTSVPDGATLVFPGALPLHLDTAYLQVDQRAEAVQFGGAATVDLRLQPTAAARATLLAQLRTELTACVSGKTASAACPLPDANYVPGSVRGRIVDRLDQRITVTVGSDSAGAISLRGTVHFTGRYRALDYQNVVHTHTGRVALKVDAVAYPVAPLTVRFRGNT